MRNKKNFLLFLPIFTAIAMLFIVYSCANMARPGGGPRDETPPVFIRSSPAMNQTNFKKNKIELEFDEIIQVEKVTEKVIVSPAQKEMPIIKTNGRKIYIELKDSLLDNTTYTIDFSDAIVDNNEKNALKNFSYAFSTGNTIDSMQVSGYLINAADLEPITGMLVGLHRSLEDSSFVKKPLDRLAISDEYGHFTIKNVAPGKYRIYALKDSNRDFKFDNPTEDIAFEDSIIIPSMAMKAHTDTLWMDTLTVDTIITRNLPHYYPNDIVLRSFNEDFKVQYMDKYERPDARRFTLYFTAPADSLPKVTPLNFEKDDWAFVEKSRHNDTITYWIKDSTIYNQDTLQFVFNYLRTDTLQKLSPVNDTLQLRYQRPKVVKKKKKRNEQTDSLAAIPKTVFMNVESKIPGTLNVYERLNFTTEHPIMHLDSTNLSLMIKQDTTWRATPFTYYKDSTQMRSFQIYTKWEPGAEYKVKIDSASITGLYGLHNNTIEQSFKVKELEKYSNLQITISGIDDPAFVELLNSSDKPVRMAKVRNGRATLRNLDPGTYYLRLIIDKNENGKYDTGNYAEKRQPEMVYYYPGKFELRENWDNTQDWNVMELPINNQKPKDITKNKPKEIIKEDENNTQQNYNRNQNSYGNGSSSDRQLGYPGNR